jgi:hypothetical protein
MEKGTKREVAVHVDAPPDRVWAVVTDVTRMGEWSPETVSGEWLDGATGPAVGARFKGTNKRGLARWSTKPRVVTADAGREFAFVVGDLTKWSYRFDVDGAGTRLAESFEMLDDLPWYFRFTDRYLMRIHDRSADLERGMGETLARIKVAVEGSPPTA